MSTRVEGIFISDYLESRYQHVPSNESEESTDYGWKLKDNILIHVVSIDPDVVCDVYHVKYHNFILRYDKRINHVICI